MRTRTIVLSLVALAAPVVLVLACNDLSGLNDFDKVECAGDCGAAPPGDDAAVIDVSTAPEPETGAVDASGPYAWARWPMPNPPDAGAPNTESYASDAGDSVSDVVTGLLWQYASTPAATSGEAAAACAEATTSGLAGWVVPTRIELVSLLDPSVGPPYLPSAFDQPGVSNLDYWSASAEAGTTGSWWTVNFSTGDVKPTPGASLVRCVRRPP